MAQITLKHKFGGQIFEVTAESVQKAVESLSDLSQLPSTCVCGSANVRIVAVKNQGYVFFSVDCQECGKEFRLGQRKEDNGLFPKWKDGWQEKRKPRREEDGYQSSPSYESDPDIDVD